MEHEQIEKRIRLIRQIHYTVFFLYFVSMFLIFFSSELKVYGALAVLFMGALQWSYRGKCPLTIEEFQNRKKLEGEGDMEFVKSVFRNNFGINVSGKIISTTLWASFLIAGYVMLEYLIFVFKNI